MTPESSFNVVQMCWAVQSRARHRVIPVLEVSGSKRLLFFNLVEVGYLYTKAPVVIRLDFSLTQRDWPAGSSL